MITRAGTGALAVALLAAASGAAAPAAPAAPAADAVPAAARTAAPVAHGALRGSTAAGTPTLVWQQTLPGVTIRESSPVVATLDAGGPAVVVGAHNGNVYAFHLSNGSAVPGWPVHTTNPVDSSPAAVTAGSGPYSEIYIGSGNSSTPGGAFYEISNTGQVLHRFVGQAAGFASEPVFSSPAIGALGPGGPAAVFGTLGLNAYAIGASSATVRPGWPFNSDNTVYSSPALVNLQGQGNDVVIGGDASPGGTYNHQGGFVWAISPTGKIIWQFATNETVRSSPVIGSLGAGPEPKIAFGTGFYWATHGGATDSTRLFVLNPNGTQYWSANLGGWTMGEPALANLAGNGSLDVIEGTGGGASPGLVYAYSGSGQLLPNYPVHTGYGPIIGGITTANLTGSASGAQSLLVPTGAGVFGYNGQTGTQLFGLNTGQVSYQNSPLVTQGTNGTIGITIAGTTPSGNAVISHYSLSRASIGTGAWPMFRLNAQHTGNEAAVPLSGSGPASGPACSATLPSGSVVGMAGTPDGKGYWLVDRYGDVASCGDAQAYGSMSGKGISNVVGMAATPNGKGYWLVGSNGAVYSFGDAAFYGSMGGKPLSRPVVGMAADPATGGYWLVAQDGGIFAFNAPYLGSTGAMRLNKPVVGMEATAHGHGYRFVASDGGIFDFGSATFHGSMGGTRLNQPVVGMAEDPATGGYWLVAADGGIFAFNAPFLGSTGRMRLARPVVGMAALQAGNGYRFVASDGGIFDFGAATFQGSAA
ncbi:MAG: hypothetical protein ACYDH5_11270 [Acidimicrobiales bacterium]